MRTKQFRHAVARALIALWFTVLAARVASATTLRVVEYNVDDSDQGNNNNINGASAGVPAIIQAIGNQYIGSNAQAPDIIALTEMLDTNNNSITSTTLPLLTNALNAIYGAGMYTYDTTPDPTTGGTQYNGPSGLIYNTHTVQIINAVALPLGTGVNRAPIRYELQPVGYGANSDFYMYVEHAKADSGSANETERNEEATEVRQNADALGPNTHIIYTGDLNLVAGSSEPSYATMTAAGNGQAHDPLVTSWTSNSSAYTYLYSESTSSLTARFDVQLVSGAVLNQPGLELAPDTSDPHSANNFPSSKYGYAEEIFGNNGTTAEGKSTNLSTNTSLSDLSNAGTILADLMQPSGSDHLPIVADYNLVGVNPVSQAINWISGRAGNWSGSANWSTGVTPNNAFPLSYGVSMNGGTATLDVNTTIDSLTLTSGTLNGSANLTLSSATINGAYNVTGTTTIAADSITQTPVGTVVFGGTTHNAGAFTGTGSITINSGATLTSDGVTINQLTIDGSHVIRPSGTPTGTSRVNGLTLGGMTNHWTGSLDLTNNKLIVEVAGPASKPAVIATLQNQVLSYGSFGSLGITSTGLSANQGIAVLDNAITHFPTFGGLTVDANSILVSQELLGDANADGHVDLTDLSTVLNNFGLTTPNWTDGNFDNAPTIDLTDLSDVLNNFGQSNPNASASSFILQPSTLPTATPEPTSLLLLLLPALFLQNRSPRIRALVLHPKHEAESLSGPIPPPQPGP